MAIYKEESIMSDRMTSIPFGKLMNWVAGRERNNRHGFLRGAPSLSSRLPKAVLTIFGPTFGNALGPAAGPNSQLAQNIAAAYFAGARFFELKTVQIMDGAELQPVSQALYQSR